MSEQGIWDVAANTLRLLDEANAERDALREECRVLREGLLALHGVLENVRAAIADKGMSK